MSDYEQSGPVRVEFPKEMKVNAPETDNLIKSLTIAFEALSRMLQASFREIADSLQTLRRLPDLVRGLQEEVTNQFTSLFTHQLEAQVFTRHANIMSAQKKREIISSHRQEKIEQLPADRERVTTRYKKLFESLAEETESRIRRMDSHVFEIVESIYPQEVLLPLSFSSMPALDKVASHARESEEARSLCLSEGLASAGASMQSFLEQREMFYRNLDSLIDPQCPPPGWYEVEFSVVETKDMATGETSIDIAPDCGPDVRISDRLYEKLQTAVAREISSCQRTPLSKQDQHTIAVAMQKSHNVPQSERERFEAGSIELFAQGGTNK